MQDLWPNAYVHALNPFVIQFTENFGIRWYGLAYLAGFMAGYYSTLWLAKKGRTVVKPEQVSDLVFAVAVGCVVGGRLGYCIFYGPQLFTQFTPNFPFWGVLAINQGGMASHGGIVGMIVACFYFSRTRKLPALALADLTTIGGSLGIFFGRIANFINGELVGRPAPPNLPWAVKFPSDILFWPSQEPARLLSLSGLVSRFGISADQWRDLVATRFARSSQIEGILYRIVTTIQKDDVALKNQLAPLLTGRHPSQLYEGVMEGLVVFAILMFIWRKPRKPGVVGGWFLFIYPIVRIFCEQYRMPDPGIGYQWLGLTRGQWLSIIMITFTSMLLVYLTRRKAEPIGGWMQREDA